MHEVLGSNALSELLQCPKIHFPLKNEDLEIISKGLSRIKNVQVLKFSHRTYQIADNKTLPSKWGFRKTAFTRCS